MMRIGAEDFAKGTLVPVNWYPATITNYEQDTDKDGAALHVFEAHVADNPEYSDVPLRIQFSEKAMGFAKEFAEALRGKPFTKEEMKAGYTFDPEKAVGKKIKIHVKRGEYRGRQNNEVDGFRPLDSQTPSAVPGNR